MNRAHKTRGRSAPRKGGSEEGFAYLMALFMMMMVLIGSMAVMSNFATQGKREREDQMITRGKECARAIRLYYQKTGHYPQTMDDLEKGIPDVHFLRYSAYKDPMNHADGAWRFIYVNGAQQIIGSVKYASLQQMAILDLNHGQIPVPPDSAGGADATSDQGGQGQSASAGQGPQSQQAGTNGVTSGQPGAGQQPANNQSLAALAQLKPTGPVDGPVIGGFLTGVASKVDAPSQKTYKGGTDYNEWEFIWNPVEDQMRAMQQGLNQTGGSMGTPSPSGTGTGTGMNFNFQPSGNPGGALPGGAPPIQQPPQQQQPQQQP